MIDVLNSSPIVNGKAARNSERKTNFFFLFRYGTEKLLPAKTSPFSPSCQINFHLRWHLARGRKTRKHFCVSAAEVSLRKVSDLHGPLALHTASSICKPLSWLESPRKSFIVLRKNQTVYARVGGGDLAHDAAVWWRVDEIIPAGMNVYTFQNDIALARIEVGHQQVIQLASRMPANNAECLIYGYGSISYQTNTITSTAIRYGRVAPISHGKCEAILGRVMAPSKGTGQFCALGRSGVDACNGE